MEDVPGPSRSTGENLPDPSSSTAEKMEVDVRDELTDEDRKGELTNALKYCTTLLQEKGLITTTPPDKISSVSKVMGEAICEEIINMLEDHRITTEEYLIMFDESDSEGQYEEVC